MTIIRTLLATVATLVGPAVSAGSVPAWMASPQPVWGPDFLFPTNIPPALGDTTVRQIVRLGYGGSAPRIVLSNAYGSQAVRVAGAHLAPSLGGSTVDPKRDRVLHFGGAASVEIAPGATVVSDPVILDVATGDRLAISLRFAEPPTIDSFHWDGRDTSYILTGDQLAAPRPTVAAQTTVRLLLSEVLVEAPNNRGTVVILGDSITDGAGASLGRDTRWPDLLATRAAPSGIAVVNAGISGARLLGDRMGSNALARFDRDVLAQPGIRTVVLLLGINDIAWPGSPFAPREPQMTYQAMVAGYSALVARAHASGVRVIAGTISPFAGALPGTPLAATYYHADKDAMRRRVNQWIRSSNAFDAVIDFDRILRDPAAPERLALRYDSGDRLHPGDAGNAAMAAAVDLDTLIGETK